MMDGAAAGISRRLIVNVESPGPHGEKDVPRAGQFIIEEHLGTDMPTPPRDGGVDVGCKQVRVMEIE
jgi:hypothetical protein